MESGLVIQLQYGTPLWGFQFPGPRILDSRSENLSTLCNNERQISKPKLCRKASSRGLGSAHARCHPCVGKWVPR